MFPSSTPHLNLTKPPHAFLHQVWASTQSSTAQELEDVEAYLGVASGARDGMRLVPGTPVFVRSAIKGKTPKKFVVRWAVVHEEEPTDAEHIFVRCAGEVLQVALDNVEPIQVRAHTGFSTLAVSCEVGRPSYRSDSAGSQGRRGSDCEYERKITLVSGGKLNMCCTLGKT